MSARRAIAFAVAGLLLGGCSSAAVSTAPTGLSTSPGVSSTSAAPAPADTLPSAAASSRSPVRKAPRPAPPTLAVLPAEPSVPGYSRTKFGPAWTDNNTAVPDGHNGCDTRNDVLREQLRNITPAVGCKVHTGVLNDPYTGLVIAFSKTRPSAVQIDHVVPLHYAWNVGASRWTMPERVRFANDTYLELLAVDGPQNQAKGDDGPSQWLPPSYSYRCAYMQRFTDVLRTYHLPIVAADLATARGCVK